MKTIADIRIFAILIIGIIIVAGTSAFLLSLCGNEPSKNSRTILVTQPQLGVSINSSVFSPRTQAATSYQQPQTFYMNYSQSETSEGTNSQPQTFNVTADNGYNCSTGDPTQAIQNAIDSLPADRTAPCNIYLQGLFDPMQTVILSSNINFVGVNARLITYSDSPIFISNRSQPSNTLYDDQFSLNDSNFDGTYQNWIQQENLTFQDIIFRQTENYDNSLSCAIYFYDSNSSGWGITRNICIYNCAFAGFYNCIQGLACDSQLIGNVFEVYSNDGLMFPWGCNLQVENNRFFTQSNPLTIEDYQERDGQFSIQGGIGLFLMDVLSITINNNIFVQDTNSTGLVFSSCVGDLEVRENAFFGLGNAYAIDVFPRPFLSEGIVIYDNRGIGDLIYNDGAYTFNPFFDYF
jgi:hypothetical protein